MGNGHRGKGCGPNSSMGPGWGPDGPSGCRETGQRWGEGCDTRIMMGVFLTALLFSLRSGHRRPRGVVLGMIGWWQANVADTCPMGSRESGLSCSAYGKRVVQQWGAVVGSTLAFWHVMFACGSTMLTCGEPHRQHPLSGRD